jgi:hypothetical protein
MGLEFGESDLPGASLSLLRDAVANLPHMLLARGWGLVDAPTAPRLRELGVRDLEGGEAAGHDAALQ